jgi:hypothetical protein
MSSITTDNDEGKKLSEVALAATMVFINAEVDKLIKEMQDQFKKGVYPVKIKIQMPEDSRILTEFKSRLNKDGGFNFSWSGDGLVVKLSYHDPAPVQYRSDYD